MQFIYKVPGYILLLFGGFCLSWGGFIVRSFETTDAWEILLLRSFFFFLGVSVFLLSMYKKNSILSSYIILTNPKTSILLLLFLQGLNIYNPGANGKHNSFGGICTSSYDCCE